MTWRESTKSRSARRTGGSRSPPTATHRASGRRKPSPRSTAPRPAVTPRSTLVRVWARGPGSGAGCNRQPPRGPRTTGRSSRDGSRCRRRRRSSAPRRRRSPRGRRRTRRARARGGRSAAGTGRAEGAAHAEAGLAPVRGGVTGRWDGDGLGGERRRSRRDRPSRPAGHDGARSLERDCVGAHAHD